jgi:hypothetical protein
MTTRSGRAARNQPASPSCLCADAVLTQTQALLANVASIHRTNPGHQLPTIRGMDWKLVFMCSSALCIEFPKHTCGVRGPYTCEQYEWHLGVLTHVNERARAYLRRARPLEHRLETGVILDVPP